MMIGYGEDSMSPECKDLIDKLLNMDYKKRLGAKGVQEIKNHPWFSSNFFNKHIYIEFSNFSK